MMLLLSKLKGFSVVTNSILPTFSFYVSFFLPHIAASLSGLGICGQEARGGLLPWGCRRTFRSCCVHCFSWQSGWSYPLSKFPLCHSPLYSVIFNPLISPCLSNRVDYDLCFDLSNSVDWSSLIYPTVLIGLLWFDFRLFLTHSLSSMPIRFWTVWTSTAWHSTVCSARIACFIGIILSRLVGGWFYETKYEGGCVVPS